MNRDEAVKQLQQMYTQYWQKRSEGQMASDEPIIDFAHENLQGEDVEAILKSAKADTWAQVEEAVVSSAAAVEAAVAPGAGPGLPGVPASADTPAGQPVAGSTTTSAAPAEPTASTDSPNESGTFGPAGGTSNETDSDVNEVKIHNE